MKSYTEFLEEFYTVIANTKSELETQLDDYEHVLKCLAIPQDTISKILQSIKDNWESS